MLFISKKSFVKKEVYEEVTVNQNYKFKTKGYENKLKFCSDFASQFVDKDDLINLALNVTTLNYLISNLVSYGHMKVPLILQSSLNFISVNFIFNCWQDNLIILILLRSTFQLHKIFYGLIMARTPFAT